MGLQSGPTSGLKLGARLLIVGFWTIIVGLLILVSVSHIQPGFVEIASQVTTAGSTTGGYGLLREWLRVLYQSGYVTFGIGSVLMAIGGALLVSTAI